MAHGLFRTGAVAFSLCLILLPDQMIAQDAVDGTRDIQVEHCKDVDEILSRPARGAITLLMSSRAKGINAVNFYMCYSLFELMAKNAPSDDSATLGKALYSSDASAIQAEMGYLSLLTNGVTVSSRVGLYDHVLTREFLLRERLATVAQDSLLFYAEKEAPTDRIIELSETCWTTIAARQDWQKNHPDKQRIAETLTDSTDPEQLAALFQAMHSVYFGYKPVPIKTGTDISNEALKLAPHMKLALMLWGNQGFPPPGLLGRPLLDKGLSELKDQCGIG